MPKNLEEKFNLYCNSENLEVNQNQFLVIKNLHNYYKMNFRSFISDLFSKDMCVLGGLPKRTSKERLIG